MTQLINYEDLQSQITENMEEYRELVATGEDPEKINEAMRLLLDESTLILDHEYSDDEWEGPLTAYVEKHEADITKPVTPDFIAHDSTGRRPVCH